VRIIHTPPSPGGRICEDLSMSGSGESGTIGGRKEKREGVQEKFDVF
jgi:hypothetical protein